MKLTDSHGIEVNEILYYYVSQWGNLYIRYTRTLFGREQEMKMPADSLTIGE